MVRFYWRSPHLAAVRSGGSHARTVRDLALFDSVVTGDWGSLPRTELKGIKLGVSRDYWFSDLDSEVERVTHEALRKLRAAGAKLVEVEAGLAWLIDLTTLPIQNHDVRPALEYQAAVTVDQLLAQASPEIQEDFRDPLPGGKFIVDDRAYKLACEMHLPKLKEMSREYFATTGVAAIVFPATMIPPALIGGCRSDDWEQENSV